MTKVSKKDFLKALTDYNKIRDVLLAGLEIAEKVSNSKPSFNSTEMFGFYDDTYSVMFKSPLSVTGYSKISIAFRMTDKHIIKDIVVKGNIERDEFSYNSIDSSLTEVVEKFLNIITAYRDQMYSTRVHLPNDRGWFEVDTPEIAEQAQGLVNLIENLALEKHMCGSPELIAYDDGDMNLFGMYFRDCTRTVYYNGEGYTSGHGYATFRVDGKCDHFKRLYSVRVYIAEGQQEFNGEGEDLLMPLEKLVEYLKPFTPYVDNLTIKYQNQQREVIREEICDYQKNIQ